MGSPSSRVILRRPVASRVLYRSFMVAWKSSNASMASVRDGPMNASAQACHRPSSTCLPSTRISLQSCDRAPWAVIRFSPEDLPAPRLDRVQADGPDRLAVSRRGLPVLVLEVRPRLSRTGHPELDAARVDQNAHDLVLSESGCCGPFSALLRVWTRQA